MRFSLFLLPGLLLLAAWMSPGALAQSAPPEGIIVLKYADGYAAGASMFSSIQWVDTNGGFVVDPSGNKMPFVNVGIGRIIYFDSAYYDEIEHNQNWTDWRAGLQSREVVVIPPNPTSLTQADLPQLEADEKIFQDTIYHFPAGESLMVPLINQMQDSAAKLSSGLVLKNGSWITEQQAVTTPPAAVPVIGDGNQLVTFTTRDGRKFENVKVTVIDTGVSVFTSDGGATVPYEMLPADLSPFPPTIRAQITTNLQARAAAAAAAARAAAAAAAAAAPPPTILDTILDYGKKIVHKVESWFSSAPSSAPAPTTNAPASTSPP